MSADLRSITNFDDLLRYLGDELDWPIGDYELDDISFEYDPDELGLKEEFAAKIKGPIRQLRPMPGAHPWGVFFVEFEQKDLSVVVLRSILSHLVIKKRTSANPAQAKRWNTNDLLFVSAFGPDSEKEIAFAHFHQESGDLPTLRVLGWNGGNTALTLQSVASILKHKLHWPESGESADACRQRWASAFRHRLGHKIQTADNLAEVLAALAKGIRDSAKTKLDAESERGPLTKLFKSFQAALIHDLTEETFADTYAQTITYGLLTAAISRTEMSEGARGTALIAENLSDIVPVTNPFLKEMLQTFLKVGGRKGGIDFDELGIQDVVELLRGEETDLPAVIRDFGNRKPGEDPVIHFYEQFLSAYNKKLKIQRGVFYTPQPVVSYIVRSVHELLQSEFHLVHGLADTTTWGEFLGSSKIRDPESTISIPEGTRPTESFVQILDPATGTATFLVEVIDIIYKHLKALFKSAGAAALPSIQNSKSKIQNFSDYWNAYVPEHLLPRLHGYELMMAPYAIAHMKIGLKLQETGFSAWQTLDPGKHRVRIYLTNALEPPKDFSDRLAFDAPALAHEAEAVNDIKRHKRFTVVIGNPPYSGISSNMTEDAQRLVDAYKIIDGAALNERKLWLQDDYVKFCRKAQMTVDKTGLGILGYITNHGFLDNPTFRGMRQSLMNSFSKICLLDLHGNANKQEKVPGGIDDKNVFEIRQGVAICLAVRGSNSKSVEHFDLWGGRDAKYGFLSSKQLGTTIFSPLHPCSPYYVFGVQDADIEKEYSQLISIWDSFVNYGTGVVTARDALTTNSDKYRLVANLERFASLPEEDARAEFELGKDARDWKISTAQADLRKYPPTLGNVVPISYRPFDVRWTHYTGNSRGLYASPCKSTMSVMLNGKNLGLITARSNASSSNDHFFVTRFISEAKCGESSRQSALFPLFAARGHDGENQLFDDAPHNFSETLVTGLRNALSESKNFKPEEISHYIYAVVHSPGYRSRYAEFLKIDFPRLPLTGNLELFRGLSRLGGELVALHLLEFDVAQAFLPVLPHKETGKKARITYAALTEFIGPSKAVIKPGWTDDTVWLDSGGAKANTTPGSSGFRGVSEAVWNFHIGGYQVCAKWLKDRKGRTLTTEDIAHYHKIVIALSNTIRLMTEIDQAIETHGGWPGAFQTDPKA